MMLDDPRIGASLPIEGLPHRVIIAQDSIHEFCDWLILNLPSFYPGVDFNKEQRHIIRVCPAIYKGANFLECWIVHLANADLATLLKLRWGGSV